MSSPPTIGSVDLESVLNVGRRSLIPIDETSLPCQQYVYTDTIYLKRQCNSNSLFSIDSQILIFGELQFLYNIFERYKSTITVSDNSNARKFPVTVKENQNADENDTTTSTIVSINQKTPSSIQSSSALKVPGSETTNKRLNLIGRTQRTYSITGDYFGQRLEGKHYGCIELPNMNLIEILEILLHTDLELVHESNNYDKENVLHQKLIFSKPIQSSHRLGQSFHSRRPSFLGT
ncbi:unnamed protein product [Rotaria socialis]|uniref:Uncharacterized protein n=1 Tax=Rotaria socialis TaxID=392032 RepID=A0A817Z7U5_9BILA|nr:unnamed protein product [Rotaria socialis]CAF4495315.1 unnamed protein product [Rotaria socialis]